MNNPFNKNQGEDFVEGVVNDYDNDEYSEVSEQSYGDALMESIKGVAIGFGLFLASFAILWWNEGNVVAEKAAIGELSAFVKVNALKPTSANNGKIIHTSAPLTSNEMLTDGIILPQKVLALKSKVEMYQWVEKKSTKTSKKTGGKKKTKTTYSYEKQWSSKYYDSDDFKKKKLYYNPKMDYQSSVERLEGKGEVKFGAFDGTQVLSRATNFKTIPVKDIKISKSGWEKKGSYIYNRRYTSKKRSSGAEVGDIRISYEAIFPGSTYSVLAKQASTSQLEAHEATNGKQKF